MASKKKQVAETKTDDDQLDLEDTAAVETPAVEPTEDTPVPKEPETTPEPKPVETPKAQHPKSLVTRAIRAGLTNEQIEGVDTDDLADWLFEIHAAEQQQRQEPAKKPVADEDDLDLDPLTDPKLATAVKRLAKQNKELQSKLDERDQREAERTRRAMNDAYDDAFDSLGQQFEKVFGKGEGTALARGSNELIRRNAALKSAGIDPASDSPLAIRRKLKKAAEALYGSLIETPAPEAKPNGTQRISKEEWDAGGTAKPTSSAKPKPSKSEQSALEAVRSFYREHNIDTADEYAQPLSIN